MNTKTITMILVFTAVTYCHPETLFLFDSNITGGSYNSTEQAQPKVGPNGSLSPSVFFKLNEKNTLFTNYTGTYEETNQVIEEEGVRWADQVLGNTLSLGWINKPAGANDNFQNKLSVFGYYELTKGTKDESLYTGLYNYYDIGLKDEIRKLTEYKTNPLILTAGLKSYYRRFPNYEGLYYLIYGEGPRWEKDYIGNRLWAGAELAYNSKLYFNAQLTYLFKLYTEDLIQKEPIGTNANPYTTERRKEHVASVNLGAGYRLNRWLNINLNLDPEIRRGNQNYYDTDRLTFIPNVYDYDLYDATLDFTLNPWQKLLLRIGYEYSYKKYTNNLAYNAQGDYTDQKLTKQDHIARVTATYPIFKNISVIAAGFYDLSSSNTKYERIYGYNYHANNVALGINYKF